MTVPDASSLDLTGGLTLAAWVNPTSTGTSTTVLMKERSGGLAYVLYAGAANSRPIVWIYTTGNQGVYWPAALPLNMNTWSHLAVTYDGATIRMYVNGMRWAV